MTVALDKSIKVAQLDLKNFLRPQTKQSAFYALLAMFDRVYNFLVLKRGVGKICASGLGWIEHIVGLREFFLLFQLCRVKKLFDLWKAACE